MKFCPLQKNSGKSLADLISSSASTATNLGWVNPEKALMLLRCLENVEMMTVYKSRRGNGSAIKAMEKLIG
ncbi:unnamed protein product [Brugia pahangi]|uniref:DUF3987 domain-containing protein n=1 Tax=Brugia pahangi TaxID=6280 RepID=A0A0N4T4I7_BRUPA|nr:unnamed protein product [Brugia pahangi]